MGFFDKITRGLKKTRDSMSGQIDEAIESYPKLDERFYEELEEILIMGDVGMPTAESLVTELRIRVAGLGIKDAKEVKTLLAQIIADMIRGGETLNLFTKPSIILVIGVNGVGKTTTIGKLAARFKAEGKKVVLGAADTFRAAAIEQLEVWADRAGADLVKHKEGSDPAAVVFDTIAAGKARNADIIICDTAGRLHNKKNLMAELNKISRVIERELPEADKEILLVLDATTGQNAVNQAREFKEFAGIHGIILTKLDGTAKGGVVLAIRNDLKIPIKFIGVGEKINDLQPFYPYAFAQALFDVKLDKEDVSRSNEVFDSD